MDFNLAVMLRESARRAPAKTAVILGDARTRTLYMACVLGPFVIAAAMAVARPLALLVFAALPLAVLPVRTRIGRGDQNHRNVSKLFVSTDFCRQPEPVHPWHFHIGDD